MNIIAVIQARMASTRLPGKVMMPFAGRKTMFWIELAAKRAKGISRVVIATSTNKENDVIEDECKKFGAECFRGVEDDVLARYDGLLDKYNPSAIVRLTGDCPLMDSNVISDLVTLYKSGGYDYVTNTNPPTWPDGLDCEIISALTLRLANKEATRKSDRDCVTRWIVRNRHRFPAANLVCPIPGLHKERWVLDSPEDLLFMETVFDYFNMNWQPNWHDIYNLLQDQPKLRLLNSKHHRNERFYESLVTDIAEPKKFTQSSKLFDRAEKIIPFAAQTFSKSYLQFPKGESPLFVSHGDGGYCYDVDGNDYVDMVGALLPNVLGYRDPDVDYAVRRQLDSGTSLSLATELEFKLASLLKKHIPCADMVKFGKSGSDVTSAAIRLAHAYGLKKHPDSRPAVFKIQNNYHGWHDWAVNSTARAHGVVTHAGVHIVERDLDRIKQQFHGTMNASGIILEPEGWTLQELRHLRHLCDNYGALLIFDEIITGFRWSLGGYQKHIGVTPDLACFGKAMANGMPLSAIVGKAEYMKRFAPPDNIFYSGTFFGETLSLAAGIATIEKMEREHVIDKNWQTAKSLAAGTQSKINQFGLSGAIRCMEDSPIARISFEAYEGKTAEKIKAIFIKEMIQRGVLIIASHNVCYAHNEPEIKIVLNAWDRALEAIKAGAGAGKIEAKSVRA